MKNKIILTFAIGLMLQSALASPLDLSFSTPCNPKNSEASISFVGDILIHKALYQAVVSESKHFNQLWNKTDPLLKKADFSVGNLEGPTALGINKNGKDRGDIGFVYDDDVYSGTNYVFNFHPRLLSDLKESGFDLLTLANNHSTDRFSIGIDRSIMAARNTNLPIVGTRKSDEPHGEFFKIVSIKNIRVAFVGCTEYINLPDNDHQVLFCETEKIMKIIRDVSARSDVDALIVLPHWGVEYSPEPKSYQKEVAQRYLEAGALAVIGSHPHVLQPWEKYTTRNGRETLIIYSLGNFVAGQDTLPRKTGTIAYIGLSKTDNHRARIFGVAYTPTYRMGTSIVPIGKHDNPDVLSHVALKYGTKNYLEPEGNLFTHMCAKP